MIHNILIVFGLLGFVIAYVSILILFFWSIYFNYIFSRFLNKLKKHNKIWAELGGWIGIVTSPFTVWLPYLKNRGYENLNDTELTSLGNRVHHLYEIFLKLFLAIFVISFLSALLLGISTKI